MTSEQKHIRWSITYLDFVRNILKKLVQETCIRKLDRNGASFWYTADQSNCTILVTCIGSSFWYKFLVRVSWACVTPISVAGSRKHITNTYCNKQV